MRSILSRGEIAGIVLLALLVGGLGLIAARAHVLGAYRHVVVHTFNIDAFEQIFVNCEQAAMMGPRDHGAAVDLGWLDPDDRVTITAITTSGDAAWGFEMHSNGTRISRPWRGEAGAAGVKAEPYAVVMARTDTANGSYLGQVGCQGKALVAASVAGYVTSKDDESIRAVEQGSSPFSRERGWIDPIDAGGRLALVVLALAGLLAAIATRELRSFARRHARGLTAISVISVVLSVISNLIGLAQALGLPSLITIGLWLCIALLLPSAIIRLRPLLLHLLAPGPDAKGTVGPAA